jgi:hypothetical protein
MSQKIPWAIAYVNAQGLTAEKLQIACNWILEANFDMVIISETWLINQDSFITNPLYLTQSLPPSISRISGHQNGGLLILAHPSLLESITIISTTEYSILMDIHGTKIATVYFPP